MLKVVSGHHIKIQLRTAIIFTKDISASKAFYNGLLGLEVVHEDGTFVLLEGNLGLHQADVFYGYLEKPYSGEAMGKSNLDLYFTADVLEEAEKKLRAAGVTFIHGIKSTIGANVYSEYMIPTGILSR